MKKAMMQVALALAFLAIGAGVGFSKTEIITINLMSAPFGTGSYVLGAALEDISKKAHPWLRISHSESPGLILNIKKLDKEPELKKDTIVASTIGTIWLAEKGLQPFDKPYKGVKLLANYNLFAGWLASIKPDLNKPGDFNGKNIALGRATQISWAIQPEMIIRYGWGMADKIKLQYVGTDPAVPALLDGLADAIVIGIYLNPKTFEISLSPQTAELLASGKKINHISWGAEAIKKTRETGMPISLLTIPPNAVKGMEKPIDSFTDSVAWCAAPEFPEELAYEITKLIIQKCSEFGAYHNLGKLMAPDVLPFGWEANQIHPGALKAYKEAGILK
jgi:hypothetical protein